MKSNNSNISHVGAKTVFCCGKSLVPLLVPKKSTMPSERTRVPMYVPSLSVIIVINERESVSIEFGTFIDK